MTFNKIAITALIVVMTTASAHSNEQSSREDDSSSQESRGERPPKPDLAEAAEKLGISEALLEEALQNAGGHPPNLEKAAAALEITVEQLKEALPPPPRRKRRSKQ